jgi:hypothetical protein
MLGGDWTARADLHHEHGMGGRGVLVDCPPTAGTKPPRAMIQRKGRPMLKSILCALAFAVGSITATAEAATPQEQAACRSDAMKFCSDHIGKPTEMSACLRDNKQSLSEPCRKVIEAHGG